MLVLTPAMFGSMLAGVALWLMFWYGVNHVDSIPYLNQYLSRKMILEWIKRNPQTALLLTEGVNLLLHGIGSAAAVFFNQEGTLVNIAVIYGFVPTRSFLCNTIVETFISGTGLEADSIPAIMHSPVGGGLQIHVYILDYNSIYMRLLLWLPRRTLCRFRN